jgi:sec-independent protein translocase protein TatC
VGFSFFFFAFGLKKVVIFGENYFLPLPTENSFSVQVFKRIRSDLLPSNVQLIATNPMSAFIAQILLSLLLGFLLTTPFFLYKIIMYLRPALLSHERRAVVWSLFPFAFLFFSGSAFAYFFLIPATFKTLYPYTAAIGAIPFFSINEFMYYVFGLTVTTGIMFLLPLFMALLSILGIIPAWVWKKNWQYACFLFLVLAAIITPDGTGVTMILLFIPLALLYFTGYFFAAKISNRQAIEQRSN